MWAQRVGDTPQCSAGLNRCTVALECGVLLGTIEALVAPPARSWAVGRGSLAVRTWTSSFQAQTKPLHLAHTSLRYVRASTAGAQGDAPTTEAPDTTTVRPSGMVTAEGYHLQVARGF